MITFYDIVYYVFFITATVTSFIARERSIPGISYLRTLLICGLLIETIVEFQEYYNQETNWPYYLYLPLEYTCLVFFYTLHTQSRVFRNTLIASAWVYIFTATLLAVHYNFTGYPGVIYNISCILNTVWLTLLLITFPQKNNLKIPATPLFLTLSAFLLFFAGIFFFNTTYNYLLEEDSTSAKQLRIFTNIFLNYILYILLSYAFLCSRTKKNF